MSVCVRVFVCGMLRDHIFDAQIDEPCACLCSCLFVRVRVCSFVYERALVCMCARVWMVTGMFISCYVMRESGQRFLY